MILSKDTKISDILRANPKAITVITSISKHFKKLNNPVLRKVLAHRVSVGDAAKIGKIPVDEFLKRLETFGFQVTYDKEETTEVHLTTVPKENSSGIHVLDVRPIIKSGADPFPEIMQALKTLEKDEVLQIINVFEPVPLISLLEEKGYKAQTERISDDEYHTFFFNNTENSHAEIVDEMPIKAGSFEEKLTSFGANIKEIDVRHLEMPEPMVTILQELETLPDTHALLVNHKKVPQFLLPELEKRQYQWLYKEVTPEHIYLIVFQ